MDQQALSPALTDVGPAVDANRTPISSEALFGDRREVVILHNGREYRLRLTQNDKLILTA
jgi:hemin uptake protein HemP